MSKGVMYDMALSKMVKKSTMQDNTNSGGRWPLFALNLCLILGIIGSMRARINLIS